MLQADAVEAYLLQYYALAAHAYTRGTWIAPESTPIDRTVSSPSFATPAGVTAAILLKWTLLWEDPIERKLWIGRALPRVWLEAGEKIVVEGAASAYGHVSFVLRSDVRSAKVIHCNLTVPSKWAVDGAPKGGLVLRLRSPVG